MVSDSETEPFLINTSRKASLYGSIKSDDEGVVIKDGSETKKTVSIGQLFRYATVLDGFLIFIGSLFAIVTGSGWPVLSYVFGNMTDGFLPMQNSSAYSNDSVDIFENKVKTSALYYTYIGCAICIAGYIQVSCWSSAGTRQIHRLRKQFFYQILRQEIGWFDTHQSGELSTRLADDLERISEGIGEKIGFLLQNVAATACGFGLGFYISWKLALVMVSVTPLIAIGGAFMGKILTEFSTQEQDIYAAAGGVAEEVLSCIKTVTAFNGQKKEVERYEKKLDLGKKQGIRKAWTMGIGFGTTFLILFAAYSLGFWYGAKLVREGEMTGGQVFTVFLCLIMGSFSMGAVTPYITALTTAKGAAVTVFEIIDKVPSIDAQSSKGIIVDSIQGNVEFRDVTFAYPTRSDIKILTKFNMVVKAGQTVALVGSSGSGKSTVINLLLRFYDPQFGKIIIDNFDIPSLAINYLRNLVAVVSQEPILFGCTIRENILYGFEDAKDSDIINAAKMANAHDFITQLPEGYNTLVGERGTQLSGGQKQRIAIARALIRNPRILLLDEATSALDAESEKAVQKALDRACEGRTTIIVAHRLSTIQNADVIYVMDKGQIVETGQHMNLMKMKGIYYQMASLQTFQGDGYGDMNEEIEAGDKSPEKLVRSPSWRLDRKLSRQLSLIGTKAEPEEEEEDLGFEKPGFCRMLRTNSPEWYIIIIGVIASMGNGTIMAIFSIIYGELFKTFSYPPNEMAEKSFLWAMVFLGLGGANFFTQVGMSAGLGISGERLTKRLRLQTFQNIVRQDIAWFDDEKHQTGKLTLRLGMDAPLVKGATGSQLSTILSAAATLIIGLTLSFYFGWKLSLVVLTVGPIAALAGMLEMKALGAMQQKDTSVMESAGKTASEAIENIRTVQALTREKTFYDIYCHDLLIPYRKRLNKAQVYGLSYGFSQGSFFFLYAVAFYYGGYLVVHKEMSADAVFRVFFGMAFSAMSVGQSFAFLPDYAKAKVAAGHIFHLMDQKPTIDSASSVGEKQQIKGAVIFRNVSFSYPMRPDVTVLKNISFSINPGQTLALVGPSGCGKSTVVALLERFYNPKSGSILLDGYDIDKINVNWLRSHISLVSQEPVLFNCSIRDNIAYGIDGFVSDDVISNVAQIANIHDFIVSLPQGYDTMVGEKGTQLSGGQKQRIAIARALIRNPKVLLLDEATSALDSESEKLVQEALNAASAGRTCLVIAHRLSTIQNANVIAVIDNGEIVEQGTHQELVHKQGVYYKLTHSQMIS